MAKEVIIRPFVVDFILHGISSHVYRTMESWLFCYTVKCSGVKIIIDECHVHQSIRLACLVEQDAVVDMEALKEVVADRLRELVYYSCLKKPHGNKLHLDTLRDVLKSADNYELKNVPLTFEVFKQMFK